MFPQTLQSVNGMKEDHEIKYLIYGYESNRKNDKTMTTPSPFHRLLYLSEVVFDISQTAY